MALGLFVSAYLVFGCRSLDSYVTVEPVSSAEAYRREVGSIPSSGELSRHTRHTLSLLPGATNAVRQSDLVTALESSQRVGDADPQILHYTYPTNGLMLALDRRMHRDLSEFFDVVDPEHVSPPMLVIGHSMGGPLPKRCSRLE